MNYFKSIDGEANLLLNKKKYKFFKYFSLLARRTGVHTANGKAFCKNFKLKSFLYNHEINNAILNYFS